MFRIKQYGELSGWRPIEMTMPLVQQAHCPCCATELETACKLVGNNATMRVGSCSTCGYLGYIDRPTEQWFKDFYAQEWDVQGQRDLEATAEKIRTSYNQPNGQVELLKQSGVGFGEPILEIGCGYGCAMQQLRDAGFSNLFGVEPCKHRADLVREVFGHTVYSRPLANLKRLGIKTDSIPYGLVYSSHVLEHCYDPREMIHTASRLQDRGGLLSICVPRQETEPTMGVLLFLPHLHSFTEASLVHLLNAHGYGTMEVHRDAQSIYVLAIKTGRKLPIARCESNGIEKIKAGLEGTMKGSGPTDRFWWNYLDERSGYVPYEDTWEQFSFLLPRPRYVNVEPCERVADAPCEVQFDGPLRLCVK